MTDRAFFGLGQRAGHGWFVTPEGAPFFSANRETPAWVEQVTA